MTRWQQIEEREKASRRAMKKCPVAMKWVACGFGQPVINGVGQCSGCRNPDDGELESRCRGCGHNEYHVEEMEM